MMYLHESKLMKLTAQQISSFLFIYIYYLMFLILGIICGTCKFLMKITRMEALKRGVTFFKLIGIIIKIHLLLIRFRRF
jgi:hypothetical protein